MGMRPAPRRGRLETPEPWVRTEWVLLCVAIALFAYVLAPVLLLIFAGIAFAVALDGLAVFASARTPLSRGWALLAISLAMTGFLVFLGVEIAPRLGTQITEMVEVLDAFVDDALARLAEIGVKTETLDLGDHGEGMAGAASSVIGSVANWGMTTIGAFASVLVFLTITGFAAADPGLYRRGFVGLFPHDRRALIEETLSAVALGLRWWFLGQVASMLLLGVSVSLGLWAIGVELWLGLGVLTALLTFVPYLGPLVAGIPIVVIAFTESVERGLVVVVAYLVLETVESNIVAPLIQQKVVHLAPVLAISTQVLLGLLLGLPGLILAAPLTVAGMVLVRKLWVEAALGDEG